MFSNSRRMSELESNIESLNMKVEVIEKEILNLYVFIDSYLEKVEAQDSAMSDIKPVLREVSNSLRMVMKQVMG